MRLIVLLIPAVMLLGGCALFESSSQMNKSAEQLAYEGTTAFADKDYKDAIQAYTDLKDWYPFSQYAILAELKIADAHYHLESYDEAILNYEEFERMHPRNEAVPYVVYQIGLSWFEQMDTVDRDGTPARNSLAQFRRLISQYPENEYAKKAQKHIKACLENISGHEFYVANFYLKTKQYKAALKRYEYLVENYPASKEASESLNKIQECHNALEKIKTDDK